MQKSSYRLQKEISNLLKDNGIHHLLIGLSGGADSVALLRLLAKCGVGLGAIHCNYHLRGEESNRDMEFCKDLCGRLGISLEIADFDVPDFMRRQQITSVEDACRRLRYDYFRKRMEDMKVDRIAVAHNADDNIETLLLNLLRGAGITGLKGMSADANGILRPLIHTSRRRILEYLQDLGQDYITDSTNLGTEYRRNFLRNEILPLLETRWPGARKAISTSIANLQSDYSALEYLKRKELREITEGDRDWLPLSALEEVPNPEWLVHQWSSQYGVRHNVAREIIRAFKESEKPDGESMTGKCWKTKQGKIHALGDALLHVSSNETELRRESEDSIDCLLSIGDYFEVEKFSDMATVEVEMKRISGNGEMWTDVAPEECIVRHPRQGDRIDSLGVEGSQLVSKILKDSKIPQYKRGAQLVVESGGTILWLAGLRRSRHHLVSSASCRAWRWRRIGN